MALRSACLALLLSWAEASWIRPKTSLAKATEELALKTRSLLNVPRIDCGLAFQPCCWNGDSCRDNNLSCVNRETGPRCEPCGLPFEQPCPQLPYCDKNKLIPSERRSDARIQCRPCGQEWQPCCANVDKLCGSKFLTCYAEEDRCVVSQYVSLKEDFFPEGLPEPSRLCGGLFDPPCLENSDKGTYWECDADLVSTAPVFLCLPADATMTGTGSKCGTEGNPPCASTGCIAGLTAVLLQETDKITCVKSFTLLPEEEAPEGESPDDGGDAILDQSKGGSKLYPKSDCGGNNEPPCTEFGTLPCECGLFAGDDGVCSPYKEQPPPCPLRPYCGRLGMMPCAPPEEPCDACLLVHKPTNQCADDPFCAGVPARGALERNSVLSQSAAKSCGMLGMKTCKGKRKLPCDCDLREVDGMCVKLPLTGDPGFCPLRPYCGRKGEMACAYPPEAVCDPCLTPDSEGMCNNKIPGCEKPEDVTPSSGFVMDDAGVFTQSAGRGNGLGNPYTDCGELNKRLCQLGNRYCEPRFIPDEDGTCVSCGHKGGALPCLPGDNPRCGPNLLLPPQGDFCVDCGGEGQPACCERMFCNKEKNLRACKEGFVRVRVTLDIGETSYGLLRPLSECANYTSVLEEPCGLVGQPVCLNEELECYGFAMTSPDGLMCIACGRENEVPCPDTDLPCAPGMKTLYDEDDVPILCVGTAVVTLPPQYKKPVSELPDQNPGPNGTTDASVNCGFDGAPWCKGDQPCFGRSIQRSDLTCRSCGAQSPGGKPQPACQYPETPCDAGFRNINSRCVKCGSMGNEVCPVSTTDRIGPCDPGYRPDNGKCWACGQAGKPLCPVPCGDRLFEVRDANGDLIGCATEKPDFCGALGKKPCDFGAKCEKGAYVVNNKCRKWKQ